MRHLKKYSCKKRNNRNKRTSKNKSKKRTNKRRHNKYSHFNRRKNMKGGDRDEIRTQINEFMEELDDLDFIPANVIEQIIIFAVNENLTKTQIDQGLNDWSHDRGYFSEINLNKYNNSNVNNNNNGIQQ